MLSMSKSSLFSMEKRRSAVKLNSLMMKMMKVMRIRTCTLTRVEGAMVHQVIMLRLSDVQAVRLLSVYSLLISTVMVVRFPPLKLHQGMALRRFMRRWYKYSKEMFVSTSELSNSWNYTSKQWKVVLMNLKLKMNNYQSKSPEWNCFKQILKIYSRSKMKL